MRARNAALLVLGLLLVCPVSYVAQGTAERIEKKRLVVLTDIEADPDDAQSLVRLLTYVNDIDIEALVATTSTHQRARVAPETIHRILSAYGKVQPNLLKHDKAYPSEQDLKSKVSKGPALYGMAGVGEGHDSSGSEAVIKALERSDPRPVWISVWGGPNVLAQALWKIQKTRSKEQADKLYAKLRVYTISDQDDSASWIRKTFPAIFYIVSPGTYGAATWSGIARAVPGSNSDVVSPEWLAKNIQQGHGPLGAEYPDISYSMEGDTPSYLGLVPNGLNDLEHPNWGSWGGRYDLYLPSLPPVTNAPGRQGGPGGAAATAGGGGGQRGPQPEPETRPIWTNAEDSYSLRSARRSPGPNADETVYKSNHVTIWRWREEYQNDFAARMDWTTKSYSEANHPPVPVLNQPAAFTVKSGDIFKLDADGTYDPDGDSLSYFWFQYSEVGTYKGTVNFRLAANLYNVHTITAPEVDSPQTVHFILKVTDKGTPALTRYKRVIVTIVPK